MHRDQYGNPRVRGPRDVAPIGVLWRDATAVALDKPTGLLAHNSAFCGPREWTLVQGAERLIGCKPALLHRLDRGTSGIVMAATDREHVAAWQAAVEAGQKDYLALVRGQLDGVLEIDHAVRESAGERAEARTTLLPLEKSAVARCTLVQLTLHTGRWRQARQHCCHANVPIIGDPDYGDRKLNRAIMALTGLQRMALHAWRLRLVHPLTGEELVLMAPIADDLCPVLTQLRVGLALLPPQREPAGLTHQEVPL